MLLFISCQTPGPTPFATGKDACDFCKMTIMDKHFGLEYVTDKGKILKFDDAACGIKYLKANSALKGTVYAVSYEDGKFIAASNAFFLKSDAFPSPMASGIAAFNSKAQADAARTPKDRVYTWNELSALY